VHDEWILREAVEPEHLAVVLEELLLGNDRSINHRYPRLHLGIGFNLRLEIEVVFRLDLRLWLRNSEVLKVSGVCLTS